MYKSSIVDIEHFLIIPQNLVLINSPSELAITINLNNIYIYIYIYIVFLVQLNRSFWKFQKCVTGLK